MTDTPNDAAIVQPPSSPDAATLQQQAVEYWQRAEELWRQMKLATIVFVVSQFVVVSVYALSLLSEDGWAIDWPLLREHSWQMLICAQALAFAAGVWEGVAEPSERARVLACAAGPIALVVWFMLQSLYLSGPGVTQIMVLFPTILGASSLFSPSWGAVAAGVFLKQPLRQRRLR